MKYMVICTVALLVCFGAAYALLRLIRSKTQKPAKGFKTALLTFVMGLVIMLVVALAYFALYSHAGKKAEAALQGNQNVAVQKVDGGYYFDGPGTQKAIVFYPGAKVEYTAYAPLMLQLAEQNYDCFLAEMPFNFAIFGADAADAFRASYRYDSWIMAGHSMGGMIAATYVDGHKGEIDGLVLLASYATSQIDNGVALCSIYGDLDGCLDKAEYENNQTNWPVNAQETVIAGGNHAQFADYGNQDGDNAATISAEEQQAQTVAAIQRCFG